MATSGRRFIVSGSVQGVGYRYFCRRAAQSLGLKGFVRNMPDGSVEIEAFGADAEIDEFRKQITGSGGYFQVDDIKETTVPDENKYGDFYIRMYPG
jgi:acylphosphatase